MSLKKIVKLQESPPEPAPLVLDGFEKEEQVQSVKELHFKELKKSSKFTEARHKKKIASLLSEFESMIKSDLEFYDCQENKFDFHFVLQVCNIAENFFIQYKKMGEIKKKAVIEVLKPYFKDDEELLNNLIEYVYPKISKSNLFRRNKTRIFGIVKAVVQFFLS